MEENKWVRAFHSWGYIWFVKKVWWLYHYRFTNTNIFISAGFYSWTLESCDGFVIDGSKEFGYKFKNLDVSFNLKEIRSEEAKILLYKFLWWTEY